jgi:hypothetical protein
MRKVYLQHWEESERGWGIRPDGCSLHTTLEERKKYLDSIYKNRDSSSIPHEYDRICGEAFEVSIKEELYDSFENGTLRLMRHEMHNLIQLKEMIL